MNCNLWLLWLLSLFILLMVRELLGCFHDVEFLPSRANCSTTYLISCGSDESLGNTTCLKRVVWVSKGMLPVKYF